MDEEYFVRLPPQPAHAADEAPQSEPDPSALDLSLLHQPPSTLAWAGRLHLAGQLLLGAGVLVLVALPFLGLWALMEFLDSLPF